MGLGNKMGRIFYKILRKYSLLIALSAISISPILPLTGFTREVEEKREVIPGDNAGPLDSMAVVALGELSPDTQTIKIGNPLSHGIATYL